jgi:hypothetical protein
MLFRIMLLAANYPAAATAGFDGATLTASLP